MIKRLQRRFIRIAMIALSVAIVLVVSIVNLANWFSVRSELGETIALLAENSGVIGRGSSRLMIGRSKHARNIMNESNWFSVYQDVSGQLHAIDLDLEDEPDEQLAAELAAQAIASGRQTAFLQDYLYLIREDKAGRTVFFLNCETRITAVRTLALISALACLGGVLLAWLFVTLASRKAVEPTLQNMERQKQFITNASHELKTPLTVISTNMELLQMETPDNQWVRSTQKQTAAMRRLVDELVYLSRLEEENAPLSMCATRIDTLLSETAEPFFAMAEYAGRALTIHAEEALWVTGDASALERLISPLLDNAVKYAAGKGDIIAEAHQAGRHVALTVSNPVAEPLTKEQCERLFDRFYRADPSRSKEKKTGFGIGLAIAAAVAEKHSGAIRAEMTDEHRLTFTCLLPRTNPPVH